VDPVTDDLDQLAHFAALSWAELTFRRFTSQSVAPPHEWPGSPEQAHLLVAISARGRLHALDCERLIDLVQDRARFLWREFLSFYP
jgi:hypothetical protein